MLKEVEEMICFASTCEEGSITGAAKALNCSKSQISRKIGQMEKRYGTKLFHRTTRSMRPTNAGLKLKNSALQLYNSHKKLKHEAQHVNHDLTGNFVITAPSALSTFLLAPVIPKMKAEFPDINFQISVSNHPLDLIANGIDLAIRSGAAVDDSLVARQVGSSKEKLYVRNEYFSACPEISTPLSLHRHNLIVNPYSIRDEVISLDNGEETVSIDPINCTRINNYQIILEVIKNSNCVGILPDYAANEAVKAEQVINILPKWHTSQRPIFLVHTFQIPVPRKLKMVRNFIAKHLLFVTDTFEVKG